MHAPTFGRRQIAWIGFVTLGLSSLAAAGDWHQFRGPNATGLAETSSTLPTTFSVDENLKWQTKLGDGVGGNWRVARP